MIVILLITHLVTVGPEPQTQSLFQFQAKPKEPIGLFLIPAIQPCQPTVICLASDTRPGTMCCQTINSPDLVPRPCVDHANVLLVRSSGLPQDYTCYVIQRSRVVSICLPSTVTDSYPDQHADNLALEKLTPRGVGN